MSHQLNATLWLINLLRRYNQLTFAQIAEYWKNNTLVSNGDPLHRSSFNRYRDAAADLFHIFIDCERSTNCYYIDLSDDADLTEWLLSSFSYSSLSQQTRQVRDRILLSTPPQGMQYFDVIVEALRAECCIEATYHKFGQEAYSCHLRPYVLKTYEGRWYLIAQKDEEPIVKTFALDRFEQMHLLANEHFRIPDDFNPKQYFAHTFGIYHRDGLPPLVTLRAKGTARNYLRLAPLHHSQQEKRIDDQTSLFHLHCHTTPDLRLAILRQGHLVEVIAPQDLRDQVAEEARLMAENYRL